MKKFRSLPINKSKLVSLMAARADLSPNQCARALDALIDLIAQALRDGEKVMISKFGRFEAREAVAHGALALKKKAANTGRRPAFKPSATFRRAIAIVDKHTRPPREHG